MILKHQLVKRHHHIGFLFHFLVFLMLLSLLSILSSNAQSSEAQSSNINVNNPQIWTNTEQNIKIQFVYQPQKPILDQPTELKFVGQNLKTGDYLKNLVANILVTHNSSGQFSNFRFSNITVPDGQFSVKYLFPDTGIYEIITRVSAKEIVVLAAFKVIVPLQSYPLSRLIQDPCLPDRFMNICSGKFFPSDCEDIKNLFSKYSVGYLSLLLFVVA